MKLIIKIVFVTVFILLLLPFITSDSKVKDPYKSIFIIAIFILAGITGAYLRRHGIV